MQRVNKIIGKYCCRMNSYRMCSTNNIDANIEYHYREILRLIGEDINRDGLLRTPKRARKAMQFLTKGYDMNVESLVNQAVFEENHDEMIIVRNIEYYSLCEHHILPFFGKAHIAYLPNNKVLGLSKLARIVHMYSRRLMIQERLTTSIANTVNDSLEANGVGVIIEGTHLCMSMRGVESPYSSTVTSCMLGEFRDNHKTRNEFIGLINMGSNMNFNGNMGFCGNYNTYKSKHKSKPNKKVLKQNIATIDISKEDIKFSSGHKE